MSERRKELIVSHQLSSLKLTEETQKEGSEDFLCDVSSTFYDTTSCTCSRNSTCKRLCPCVKSGKKCDITCHGQATKSKCENK